MFSKVLLSFHSEYKSVDYQYQNHSRREKSDEELRHTRKQQQRKYPPADNSVLLTYPDLQE